MLLLCVWWVLLVGAYSAALAWMQLDDQRRRAAYAADACSPTHADEAARQRRAQTGAYYAGLVLAALSTGSLLAHFVTPRMELRLGLLGNTTL